MFGIIEMILLFLFCDVSILDIPVASYVSSAKIYENLKIPQPPKKPVNAFFRFAKDRLDGKQLTIEDRRNAFKSLSAEWKQMDESTRAQLYPDCKIALVGDDELK